MEFLQEQFDQLSNFYNKALPFLPEIFNKMKKNNDIIQNHLEEFGRVLIGLNNRIEDNNFSLSKEDMENLMLSLNDYAQNLCGEMQKEKTSLLGINQYLEMSNNIVSNQYEHIQNGYTELTIEEKNYAQKLNINENVLLKQKQDVIEKFFAESSSKNKNQINNLENASSNIEENNIELNKPRTITEEIFKLKTYITTEQNNSTSFFSGNTFDMETYKMSLNKKIIDLEEFGWSFELETKFLNEEYENICENLRTLSKNNNQLNITTKLKAQQEDREQV